MHRLAAEIGQGLRAEAGVDVARELLLPAPLHMRFNRHRLQRCEKAAHAAGANGGSHARPVCWRRPIEMAAWRRLFEPKLGAKDQKKLAYADR